MPNQLFVGDEVDYSAPYLTVEDGALVTRYPAREHVAEPLTWLAPTLAVALLLAVLFIRRRRDK